MQVFCSKLIPAYSCILLDLINISPKTTYHCRVYSTRNYVRPCTQLFFVYSH
jgi:hypothetical protein